MGVAVFVVMFVMNVLFGGVLAGMLGLMMSVMPHLSHVQYLWVLEVYTQQAFPDGRRLD